MGIYVKGMEMPTNADMAPTAVWVYPNGYAIVFKDNGRMKQYTQAVPVPPHGRLIDADALHKLFEDQWHYLQVLDWNENPTAEARQSGVNWCINTMHDDAPTVIEAEEGMSMGVYIKDMEMPKEPDEMIELAIFGDGKTLKTGESWRSPVDGKCYYGTSEDMNTYFAEELSKPQWIPVTERLPEVDKNVLVFACGNEITIGRMKRQTENGYHVFIICHGIARELARPGRITHWMPLPSAPTEGK